MARRSRESSDKKKTDISSTTWYILVGLVSAIFGIVAFVTGKNLPDFFSHPTPSSTATLVQRLVIPDLAISQTPLPEASPTTTATLTPTITPTVLPTHTTAPNRWSGILAVRLPTLNEIRDERPISLWDANRIDVADLPAPGERTYTGAAQVGSEYLLPVYWCTATADLLAQNMENMETVFTVNDEVIPEKAILNYNYDTQTGWKCNYHAVVLGGWVKEMKYTIEIKRTLAQPLSDGQADYAPGEYIYRFTVTGK